MNHKKNKARNNYKLFTPNAEQKQRAVRLDVLLDQQRFTQCKGKLGREHLIRNGLKKSFVKKLTDDEAWELSLQHMRSFIGMDRSNLFTGT